MLSFNTIQALGSLGEFVSALAVVISLIYLAQQMSQNTTSVRAASFNSMVQNSIRLLEHAFRDSEFADFLHRAQTDPEKLTPSERVRWASYMTAVYRHFDDHGELLRHAVAHCWREFERALAVAAASSDDPFLAFRAAGDAYLAFAREQPGKYRVLFSNKVDLDGGKVDLDGGKVDLDGGKVDLDLDEGVGVAAFDHLVGMVTAMLDANGDGRDPYFVAVQVHTWIHGMVDLTGRHPSADWPPLDALLDDLARRLGLVAPSTGSG